MIIAEKMRNFYQKRHFFWLTINFFGDLSFSWAWSKNKEKKDEETKNKVGCPFLGA